MIAISYQYDPQIDPCFPLFMPRETPTVSDWASENVTIPDGPYRGQPFDPNTQPFARLFLAELDSNRWDRIAVTGPTQTGKTLICYVIPVLYHLFAIGETVVAGVPTLDMADDKWKEDFLPVIEASPTLRSMLPTGGAGSRAGRVRTRVKFTNGATLRFMSGGGSDKTRAGFTTRVLAVTEIDGLDQAGTTSRESDKLKQMEARQRAHLASGIRTYLECTVTTAKGRIWQEYTAGTQSRIARPCPHCGAYVTPEREHLVGWNEAEHEIQARANAAWSCPACGECWTESERLAANLRGVLVHRGQEITPEGQVVGPLPGTRTLGFRWTAADNHFATAADVAADEWNALKEFDHENAEKELRQFVHCLPYEPPDVDLTPLDPKQLQRRMDRIKKGVVPRGCTGVTVGVDTGKRLLHWVAGSWFPAGGGWFHDYDTQPANADRLGVKPALVEALHKMRERFSQGWENEDGLIVTPSQVWIDSAYHEHTDAVYEFCQEANDLLKCKRGQEIYRPTKGYGEGQRRNIRYTAPKKTSTEVWYVGDGYHIARSQRSKMGLVHVDANHWKSELHHRLGLPGESPQAIVLYQVEKASDHYEFAAHITAEKQVEHWIEGKGPVIAWEFEGGKRPNHYLDAAYACAASGHLLLALRSKPEKPLYGRTLQQMQSEARRRE